MSPKNKPLSKLIAWNGILLTVPITWEIDSLDASHLLIGEEGLPKAEIKWTDPPKKFTLIKHLKQFISRSQKQLDIKIHELPTPKFFSHTQKKFDFFFFSWESETSTGNGTLIFCTKCKRLTMIRFFSKNPGISKAIQESILASFHDHPKEDHTHWQIFGLNFPTPTQFTLLEYSFKPGLYAVSFKHKKIRLEVFSWGPAQFLLSNSTLVDFAKQRIPQLTGLAKTGFCSRGSYLEWSFKTQRLKNADAIPLLNRFFLFTVFRICHDPKTNRIFGVLIDSPKQFEMNIMKRSMLSDI